MAHSDPDHTTRHAVMVCIDGVAKRQGGGAWCSDSERKEQGLCYLSIIITSQLLYGFLWVQQIQATIGTSQFIDTLNKT